MTTTQRTSPLSGDVQPYSTIQQSTMKPNTMTLTRLAGVAAMGAGVIFAGIQPIHPLDVRASVTTDIWVIIQSLKTVMAFLFLAGITGVYARQVEKAGWLGLVGYLLFSLSWVIQSGFIFAEAFFLPVLATEAPLFVEGFLGIINGSPSLVDLGVLPVLYAVAGVAGYVFGGVLFGVAIFRARVLPRWAGAMLAFAAVSPLVFSTLLPHPLDRMLAVPMGVAMLWLGYALWSGRRTAVVEPASVA